MNLLAKLDQLQLEQTKNREYKKQCRSSICPSEDEQIAIAVRHLSARMVSHSVKMQTKLYYEKRTQSEFRQSLLNAEKEDDENSSSSNPASGGHHGSGKKSSQSQGEAVKPQKTFTLALKNPIVSAEYFQEHLKNQAYLSTRNACTVFEACTSSFKPNIVCQFSHTRAVETVNATSFAQILQQPSSLGHVRLEDANQPKKKEGICLVVDPSYNTGGYKIFLQVDYLKPIGLNDSEAVQKVYPLWADENNAYKTQLTKQYHSSAAKAPSPESVDDHDHANSDAGNTNSKHSLPGWGSTPPIFIPATECKLRIVIPAAVKDKIGATLTYQISKLCLLAYCSATLKSGAKKLSDFSKSHFKIAAANTLVPGGVSSLSLAASYGHLDTVGLLLSSGAQVNTRNKNSRFNTALIDATLGGHKEIVSYLLAHGANQLLKDEMGCIALHHAVRLGDMAIARILVNGEGAKRALTVQNKNDQKPIDVCYNDFMLIQIEGAMKRLKVFVKPRAPLVKI